MSTELVRLVEEILFPLVLPFPRMLVALNIIPIFASRAVPMIVRVGLVLSFAVFMHPANVAAASQVSFGPISWGFILVKEGAIGLVLGFLCSLYVMALEALGSLIDTVVGNNNLYLFNPMLNAQAGPYSGLFSMFGAMYYISQGGLFLIVGGFVESFIMWPVLSYGPEWSDPLRALLLARSSDMLVVMMQLGMPLLIMLMIIDLALGLLNRKASEIQVFVLSLPIKTLIAVSSLILILLIMSDSGGPLRRLLGAGTALVRGSP
jgi:type III secretion protein T